MSASVCPICGSSALHPGLKDLLRCRECGIQFLRPESFPRGSARLYGREYFRGKVYRDYLGEENERTERFRRKLRVIENQLPAHGRVLDVGCAAGFFLKLMRERGYSIHGLDLSAFAVRLARVALGMEVRLGDIRSAGYPAGYFDLVTMWDVLEHMPDPLRDLQEAHRVLRPKGILVAETLNIGSIGARLLGERWSLYALPYHLFYFTQASMKRLLTRTGFELLRIVPVQAYIPFLRGAVPWSCVDRPVLRGLLGSFFSDVLIYVAVKDSG